MTLIDAICRASLTLLLLAISACGGAQPSAPENWTETLDESVDSGWVMNVHMRSHDERYAVGGTLDAGVLLRWDEAAWSRIELGAAVPLLNWVTSVDEERLVVVGREGTVLHVDGGVPHLIEVPTTQNLWGVWSASPDDVWAVGGDGLAAEDKAGVVLRYDGAQWTEVVLPVSEARGPVYAWFKVWGSGPSDVYIVGQGGAVTHYDGETFRALDVGIDQDLIAVWGTGPDRVALVGGRNNGVVARWDGVEWRQRAMAPMPGLNAVWMQVPDRIHVGANYGTLAVLNFMSLETVEEISLDTTDDVHAMHGASDDVVMAVGGNLMSMGMGGFTGIAYERALREGE